MNRKKFLRSMKRELRGLPKSEISALTDYFDEVIAERMDRGLSEAEAVAALGSPKEAAANILSEMPAEMREAMKQKSGANRWLKVLVLICASPILISLIAVAFALVITLLASYVSVVIAMFAAAAGCAAGVLGCGVLIFVTDTVGPLMGIGAASVCAGLAVLFALCGIMIVRHTVKIRIVRRGAETESR